MISKIVRSICKGNIDQKKEGRKISILGKFSHVANIVIKIYTGIVLENVKNIVIIQYKIKLLAYLVYLENS